MDPAIPLRELLLFEMFFRAYALAQKVNTAAIYGHLGGF